MERHGLKESWPQTHLYHDDRPVLVIVNSKEREMVVKLEETPNL